MLRALKPQSILFLDVSEFTQTQSIFTTGSDLLIMTMGGDTNVMGGVLG
jgi:exopolysaccharide biosynthesis predicted pyruvyltransferase EpsI